MHLPLSAALAPGLVVLEECGSTNTELVVRAASLDDFAVLVTDNQTDGRGRLGRSWVAPPGETIALSVLLRPVLPSGEPLGLEHYGWLPLISGLAMTRALAPLVPQHRVTLKWPNDVQVDGQKVSGLLGELLQGSDGLVMGAGVNLTIGAAALPTPTSTSLVLNGADPHGLADAVLSGYLTQLHALYSAFVAAGGDAGASGVSALVSDLCSTLSQRVRVELPAGDQLFGTAIDVDGSGRLRVRRSADGVVVAVAAGDVTHLRYE